MHDDLDDESERMVVSALARLAVATRQYECPVLISKVRDGVFTAPIDTLVDERIQCLETDQGVRFIGGEFEPLVYPVGNGIVQTTLAFWKQILEVIYLEIVVDCLLWGQSCALNKSAKDAKATPGRTRVASRRVLRHRPSRTAGLRRR
ncbi:hypothetical protein [Natrinema caseinilyticum]|uniref:hypothetical protein n=1 Tax=Natrinema caseinilyticum TaxID=2961570 RepID=UPI0020C4F841|nr:hypothetical protein [Natrinema caseinilyticum]